MTGDDEGAGNIEHTYFFELMKSVERSGIPTRFPHS